MLVAEPKSNLERPIGGPLLTLEEIEPWARIASNVTIDPPP